AEQAALPAPEREYTRWERYGVPFVLPVTVVAVLIYYVLNVSRVFLAAEGSGAVVAAIVMTLTILIGATVLSAAPNLRTSSTVLIVAGVFASITLAGWLTVGDAAGHGGEDEVVFEPVVATGSLTAFDIGFRDLTPDALPVGVTEFTVTDVGQTHTFLFKEPTAAVEGGKLTMTGPGDYTVRVSFTEPGEYTYYCDISGHEAGGMIGTLTVDETLEATPIEGGGEGETPSEDAPAS
ncbi:MAG TPA: plastocyanin/azurin family copper-binding protein, partial [Acidimicrobiia bacterium]|nr:plastocyanin/azurin family copper-binding protein [Acidimicrobiia bacterium]